ncbi:penicillin-binding protein activator LpoB [Carboxylicivirga sp. RSCT41]|uniref:penicillin-binding protein activator LpoB n=1 Tax=Carboxylicivirga agarovorans TaxID=3417570 RepID=UPI003D3322BF
MKRNFIVVIAIALTVSVLSGCATRSVERVDTKETIDLSGRWNDTDSRIVAEEMVNQVLGGAWIGNHQEANNGEKPVVVVGLVYNKSHEHISAETFVKDVERAFINSGRVRLVQAGDKREELRRERAAQQEFASMETAKAWGKELGADFMLNGDINSIVDTYKKERVNFYKINMELSNLETNEIVWIGDKEIKKYINK